MGEKKESAKHWLGVIAIGCALAVACVAAAPLVAVVGVTVAGISISAAAVTGTTAVVAAIGATAALTKAGLHLSDGEYQEAVESAVMAVPLIGAAGAYGSMYLSQVRPPGNMTTGATSTQSSSGQNIKPNQNGGKTEGTGGNTGGAGISNKQPIKPNEVTTYEDFKNRSVVGDGLEGHEVWQHANINEQGLATTRLSTEVSKQNPVIALTEEIHAEINSAQRLFDPRIQTPIENVNANLEILRNSNNIPQSSINQIESMTISHINNSVGGN